MNAHLHLHSEYSRYDATITSKAARKRAEEMKSSAVALTDHGVLIATEIFKQEFMESPVKFIPGVEIYVASEKTGKREHLVLLAMDDIGYKAMYKGVTASNKPGETYPIFTIEMLKKFYGPGSAGHGHIIALSACMQGVLCSELLYNYTVEHKAEIQDRRADRIEINYSEYMAAEGELEQLEEKLEKLTEKSRYLAEVKKKPYAKKLKDLEKIKGTSEYEQAKADLDAEIAETEKAKVDYPTVKEQCSAVSKDCTELRQLIRKLDEKAEKKQSYIDEAATIRASKKNEAELYANAKEKAMMMVEIFGKENFYCELQYHGIAEEAEAFPQVLLLAKELGLQTVATNDAHIPTNSAEDRKRRQILTSLRFNTWKEERVGDDQLYMKTDAELREALVKILPADDVDKAIANNEVVASRCNVKFDTSNHYPRWNGKETAEERLWSLCEEGKKRIYGNKWTPEHQKRLEYEMEVIKKLDVCDYLAIVQDFLEYGRLLGRIDLEDPRYLADPYNFELLEKLAEGRVGMGIGFGRGSAVGSLVCYLTGITGADPIKYNLIFERFLNVERVTMPDIDSDFSPAVRGKVLEYVKHKYGEAAVCGIMNRATQAAKAAIRNVARLHGSKAVLDLIRKSKMIDMENVDDGDENEESSVKVPKELEAQAKAITKKYLDLGSQISAMISDEPKAVIADSLEEIQDKLVDNKEAMNIVNDALLVEGSFVGIGLHAAGVIISDNGDVGEYLPLMYSKDGLLTTQCDKTYCEGIGLLKMDFLGLRNLSIITETLRSIEKNTGKKIDVIKDVPLDDKKVFSEIFAKGDTDSVFQFESDGMKGLLRRFKPENVEHLILLNAMFRPGPLQYMDAVCDVKIGKAKPEYIIPEMKDVLGVTYGKPLYQEQIMALFNRFAGFSLGEADKIRKYMSKKESDKMAAYKPKFIDGLIARGATKEATEAFWEELVKFSKYAFNKSHACAYAVTAYYTAWLKYHYPKEYLTAMLNDTTSDKVGRIIANAKTYGISVLPPDVNSSEAMFVPCKENASIRYGLSNVKQVASAANRIVAARKDGPFKSYEDFAGRTGASKSIIENLIKAGALDCLADKNKTVKAWRIEKLKELGASNIPESDMMALVQEKEVLGAFLSRNPTRGYEAKDHIDNLTTVRKDIQLVAVITNYKEKKTKRDEDYASFVLEDETGTIDAVCWPRAFEHLKSVLGDSRVLSITGHTRKDSFGDEEKINFEVDDASAPNMAVNALILSVEQGKSIGSYLPTLMKYNDPNGIPMYARQRGKTIPVIVKVTRDILEDPSINQLLVIENS